MFSSGPRDCLLPWPRRQPRPPSYIRLPGPPPTCASSRAPRGGIASLSYQLGAEPQAGPSPDVRDACYGRCMTTPPEPLLVPVGRAEDLAPGQSRKFLLQCAGGEIEAFVVNHGGALYAYVNRCCHIPMSMDWVENQFFTDDAAYI